MFDEWMAEWKLQWELGSKTSVIIVIQNKFGPEMHPSVDSSTIYSSQDLEATCVHQQMNI